MASVLALIVINYKYIASAVYALQRELFLVSLSIAIAGILFLQPIETIVTLTKVMIVILLAALNYRSDSRIILFMSDAVVLCLIIIGVASNLEWIPNKIGNNGIWIKNYFGFVNPNLAPFFAFSSLFVYFVLDKKMRFWALLIAILIGWLWLDVYSRTYLAGTIMLLIYMFFSYHKSISKALMNYVIGLTLFGTLFYVLISLLLVFGVLVIDGGGLGYFNAMLSGRLFALSLNDLYVGDSGPLLHVIPFDSIYYELFFLLGPYALYKWVKLCHNSITVGMTAHNGQMLAYALSVFALCGLVEGSFMKVSPMILLVVMMMSYIFHYPDHVKADTLSGITRC